VNKQARAAEDQSALEARLLAILTRHVGLEKAVDMGELYERVFEKTYAHKINGTRQLRTLITDLRHQGALIGETRSREGGGYYLARSAHELNEFFERRKREALKKLLMVSRMKRISLAELLGQMQMNLGERREGHEGHPECG
jgi:hypothetical protein